MEAFFLLMRSSSFEEMIVVCLFLFGEPCLFTTDRWRTLSSLQLLRVIFNSCSFYTTMSFREFYFSLLSGYHFNMSTSNGFFLLSSPCKDHLTSLCLMSMGIPTASMGIMPMVCRVWVRTLHKLDRPVTGRETNYQKLWCNVFKYL